MAQTKKPKLRRWGRGPNPLILKKSPTRCPEVRPTSMVNYEIEQEAFARVRAELLEKYPGKHVVFIGEDMLGPFETFGGAVRAAYTKYGRRPIYAKELVSDDSVR